MLGNFLPFWWWQWPHWNCSENRYCSSTGGAHESPGAWCHGSVYTHTPYSELKGLSLEHKLKIWHEIRRFNTFPSVITQCCIWIWMITSYTFFFFFINLWQPDPSSPLHWEHSEWLWPTDWDCNWCWSSKCLTQVNEASKGQYSEGGSMGLVQHCCRSMQANPTADHLWSASSSSTLTEKCE